MSTIPTSVTENAVFLVGEEHAHEQIDDCDDNDLPVKRPVGDILFTKTKNMHVMLNIQVASVPTHELRTGECRSGTCSCSCCMPLNSNESLRFFYSSIVRV